MSVLELEHEANEPQHEPAQNHEAQSAEQVQPALAAQTIDGLLPLKGQRLIEIGLYLGDGPAVGLEPDGGTVAGFEADLLDAPPEARQDEAILGVAVGEPADELILRVVDDH